MPIDAMFFHCQPPKRAILPTAAASICGSRVDLPAAEGPSLGRGAEPREMALVTELVMVFLENDLWMIWWMLMDF
jgi:hypothetical protein